MRKHGGGVLSEENLSVTIARRLRRSMTPPELTLWLHLRTRPAGFRFRKQHPRSPYILDFYCPTARLAIEVDGTAHDMGDNPHRDVQRDAQLAKAGIEVLRFPAADVQRDLEAVSAVIVECCRQRTPPPPSAVPLPMNAWGGK